MVDTPQDVKAIFAEAIRKATPQEQAAYLNAACGSEGPLRAEVESLVRAHRDAGPFLRVLLEEQQAPETSPVTEGPGTVIGRYKLLEKIGEGGMAVVYMAEQTEPIRRKVALKIIKLGMDTRQVIARFEAERQALALMDHPSIAKVLDAGATDTGRPYFVMELVQGVSITEYCDTNSLSTKERLTLFLQVCHAVQHAHQKGIIHRDIKPSNVMVTHHDGKPMPKVIDFGIAKATVGANDHSPLLTEKTLFTRYAHLIGTPAYMSPEQAELSDLDIDTRSDIYSLGVLLYELLTGTTPFSEEELRKAGYVEMQRVIREQEPMKPSTRIKTALRRASVPLAIGTSGGDARPVGAGPRACPTSGGHGGPPLREVRGDLDWIVMKTLEKDRARRYETASGLAEDIRRHLEHEPVLARGPSTAYRLHKFLRRHRVKVLSGSVFAVLLVMVMVVLFLWQQAQLELALTHDKEVLSQAREQHARGDRQSALEMIQSVFDSRHVGPEARLLAAGILAEDRRSEESVAMLGRLIQERPEIAGPAHSLWARILWENGPLDTERLSEIAGHRRQATRLRPETAEAYFSEALTAVTIKEQLAALHKALQLDPDHYESRRLRAFTYYASRKYEYLKDDAVLMMHLRPADPLGYSLRAAAWRELGRYQDALGDYDKALSLTPPDNPQYLDVATQRCETFLRMGDYERAVSEAQACLKLWPDKPVFSYHLFSALTALGDYGKAADLSRQIVSSGQESRLSFDDWQGKYVFDTLAAGRSWHPVDKAPAGAAFLSLVEAEDNYRSLSAKARCVIRDCFGGQWSPDGKKLAFSLGVHGYSGVALFDPAIQETDLLIVPGKDPRWSPDGKFIVFVRDCQALRMEELATAERRSQGRALADEEIWIMNSDGTEPRRLARGGYPSWGQDATCVYYQSRVDNTFNSISIIDRDAQPRQIMTCSYSFPSVSPDSRRVAYLEGGFLKVKDLDSQGLVAEWPTLNAMAMPGWSPTGEELCVGMSGVWNTSGLWIYRFDRHEPVKVLAGPMRIRGGAWALDRTKLVFHLGPPYFEIWSAALDPKVAAIEALAPGQTLEEHWRDMVHVITRRIEAEPQDANAYWRRAQYYDSLHDRTKAEADMRRWSAAASGPLPCDFRCVIDMPFDCELVFSAERSVHTISTMSVAFGQKGRCEMKLFEVPMVVTAWVGLCFLTGLDAPPARADFTFGQPTNPGPTINSRGAHTPSLSPDGLELYFHVYYPDLGAPPHIYVSRRATQNSEWGVPIVLGPPVYSPSGEGTPSISADGLSLYFARANVLYVTKRATTYDNWGPPVGVGAAVGTGYAPCISADELELYFQRSSGGYGLGDLWVTTRATVNDNWGAPVNLGPTINTPAIESYPGISPDGLLLFFGSNRPGGSGYYDVYMARRATKEDPWGPPMNLGPIVNTASYDFGATISFDGSTLYFYSRRPGGCAPAGDTDVWQAPIIPVVDFNGDGKVDAAEMTLLVAEWGQSNSLCDIGPYAWGDGVVDEKDLKVLMESLVTPGPRALDVPCGVILSWVAPSLASACDVYFGASREAVTQADRGNPLNVLVSKAQVGTTYDPEGLLDFSRTYYWRVDFVIPGPTPTIYAGPVLSFTTEAFAYPIKGVTATASGSQGNMGPHKTVDGSGLDQKDGHSTNGADMWLSTAVQPRWIQYGFDKVHSLHELWVWNSNQSVEPFIGFGARTVKIEYSADGKTWTPLANVPEFARAPGKPGYAHNTTINFGGVSAKYVNLTIEKGWGTTPSIGLSEVRFFYIPTASAPKP
ncbi:MAG: protein kinase [Planctomycetes bacterium]|nr:protein kinase [Planctomycetota bacterium]